MDSQPGVPAIDISEREAEVLAAVGEHLTNEAAGARLKAHTGIVRVARLTGSAQISNGMGDITGGEAVAGKFVLRTGSGNVAVGAAAGVSAALDASTGRGRIHNALMNADGAAAALTIEATTEHGDISAASR
jgi:hypothetical protein